MGQTLRHTHKLCHMPKQASLNVRCKNTDQVKNNLQAPVVGNQEKAGIRAEIPRGLADPDSKIRTAVAMAIASIACTDVPHEWPTLVDDIVGAISSRTSPLLVSGSVRCLSMFVEELDEEPLIQVAKLTKTEGVSTLFLCSLNNPALPHVSLSRFLSAAKSSKLCHLFGWICWPSRTHHLKSIAVMQFHGYVVSIMCET